MGGGENDLDIRRLGQGARLPGQQILLGSFLGRAFCLEQHTCATGDDVLVLDRQTGLVKQYVFSFANQFSVFDNRAQAFLREGLLVTRGVLPVDVSTFALLNTVGASILDEELY